jgi:hypothetical protein
MDTKPRPLEEAKKLRALLMGENDLQKKTVILAMLLSLYENTRHWPHCNE